MEKGTFISSVTGNPEEEYYLGKSVWSTTESDWKQRFEVGDVIADPSGSWEPSTAEAYIDSQIATVTSNLASETLARQAADTGLQNQVDTLAATVGTGGSIDTRIQAEATTRANADTELSNRITPLEQAVGTGGTVDQRIQAEATRAQQAESLLSTGKADKATTLAGYGITDAYTKSQINNNYYTVAEGQQLESDIQDEMAEQKSIISATLANQQTKIETLEGNNVIVVDAIPEYASAMDNTIYRLKGSNSYTDYMKGSTQMEIIATYSFPGIDDEPTDGSDNLVKSGGVYNEFLKINGQETNYIDNVKVNYTNSTLIRDPLYYLTKDIPLVEGSEYVWDNGEATGENTFIGALIYKSDNTTRKIGFNMRFDYSLTFTAQEGDVKAIFTFKKGLSDQFISCDGNVIWEKKDKIYGLAEEVSDLTNDEYREEAVPFEWISGKAIATDGTDTTDADYIVSSFIPVQEGEQYRLTSFNTTTTSTTNTYLNFAAYSNANVESFVPNALPFYFNGRFEQSIAVIIPKGVKYVRITGMVDGQFMRNEWGCFHIISNNKIKAICGVGLRYIGRNNQTLYLPTGSINYVTINNRRLFNLSGNATGSQVEAAQNCAILKVSAGDMFTINKPVGPSAWYNTKFYNANLEKIKEYSNEAYSNKVILAPEGAAWLYIAFDDNCYIGAIEEEQQDTNIENESVRSYLDNVEYDNSDYSYSLVKHYVDNVDSVVRKDQPRGKEVTWKKNENSVKQYATIVTDYGRHEVEISNSIDSYIAFNTIPNAANICKISAELSDQSRVVLASQKVQMDGSLRMIKADSLINIRDLGGWVTEDGRVTKYNSIFRGCHPSKSPYQITEADRLMMVNLLGITVDVDLSETSGTQTESPFGEGVEVLDWDSIAVHWYDFATAEAIASSKTKLVSQLTALLPKLRNGDVLYMHCLGGADRTGVACMNIEAILGMQESDMLKDYEMTSFSSYGLRERNDTTRDHPMEYVIPLVKACQGANLSEKWINWLSDSGLTSETVTALRELMLM